MFANAIKTFKDSVSPEKTRVESLSPLILVFGGSVPVGDKYTSCRNVFLTWAHETKYELANFLRIPEQFPEWNQFEGYSNLVDFERDAGCLSRGILLFSECPGALAELGAFCTDEVLCERLLVVLAKEHYDDTSFIRLGPVKRIEDTHSEQAICVVGTTKDTCIFETEVEGVGDALRDKVKTLPKTKQFKATETRDQFLLIADLIELFGALTKDELESLLLFMGVSLEPAHLKRMLKQLILFELIVPSEHTTHRFYVPPKERNSFLNYSAHAESKFERTPFKLKSALPSLKSEHARMKAYAKIHGEPKWI